MRKDDSIKYAMVNVMNTVDGDKLAAHLVLSAENDNNDEVLKRLEDRMHAFLPSGVEISGYKFHRFTF